MNVTFLVRKAVFGGALAIAGAVAATTLSGCSAIEWMTGVNPGDVVTNTLTTVPDTQAEDAAREASLATEASLSTQEKLQALYSGINQKRIEAGVPPLNGDPALGQLAQSYAQTMASTGEVSHIGPDGQGLRSRIAATGQSYRYFNENLAAGYAAPSQAVQGWFVSSGHKANMLNADINIVGLGYAPAIRPDDPNRHYWVMIGAQQ